MARICSLPEERKVKWGNTVCMMEGGAILNKTAREDFAEVLPELRPQGARQRDHANRRGKNAPGRWIRECRCVEL